MSTHPKSPAAKPAIVVQLLGGIGNQMFQAAAGLALCHRLGGTLQFDLSRFRARGLRGYALGPFKLDARIREAESPILSAPRALLNRYRGEPHRPVWWTGPIHREPFFHYDPSFEMIEGDVLLAGYFQSPRYFAAVEKQVAETFAPVKLASEAAINSARMLLEVESAAIHLRRGDYASDPRALAVHGVLGFDYYDRAVEHLLKHRPGCRLFVFSDDPEAAREAARRWPGCMAMPGASAGDDLYLMSAARHHIIANSSFSWWSAWLDRRPDGIVIAPKAWFTPSALSTRNTADLLPAHWTCL